MKVDTRKGVFVEAQPNWLPCCAAVHQCVQKYVPVGPLGRCSNQEFGTRAARVCCEEAHVEYVSKLE